MGAVAALDQIVSGQEFRTLTPTDLTNALEIFSRDKSPNTARHFATHVRMFYGWLNDGTCPPAVQRALRRVKAAELVDVTPLTRDELERLLWAAQDLRNGPMQAQRRVAILWLLWDTGFRISEALALRIRDVKADAEGALLTLPKNGMDLKTGPRAVYVVECWGALQCWLAVHPRKNDPEEPLFGSFRTPRKPIHSTEVQGLLKVLGKRAGVRIGPEGMSELHPHLFRHTRATRAAENGWVEAELRAYFGWSAKSPMPAHYVHLAKRHMTQKIRDEALLDPILQRVKADPKKAIAEASAAGGVAAAREMLDALGLLPTARRVESK